MADALNVDIEGMPALLSELRSLPERLRQRVLLGAVAKGAVALRDIARELAPEYTGDVAQGHPPPGTLKAAIYAGRLMDQCTRNQEAWIVSVRSGKKFRSVGKKGANLDAYYARWVEFGHYTRAPKDAGATRRLRREAVQAGAVAGAHWVLPTPFMRPAFDMGKGAVAKAMQAYITENLPAAAAAANFLKVMAA